MLSVQEDQKALELSLNHDLKVCSCVGIALVFKNIINSAKTGFQAAKHHMGT